MKFSQRMGITPVRVEIQVDAIDDELRNSLWNCLHICYWEPTETRGYEYDKPMQTLMLRCYATYFKQPVDLIPDRWFQVVRNVREFFFKCDWHEVYDFIEFVAENYDVQETNQQFIEFCNTFLESELSAYRFVNTKIVQITSETEIDSIQSALADATNLKPVYEHLKTSLSLLSDRKNPDYRNSIKEAISAVEATCQLVGGNKKDTLGQAIKKLKDNGVAIHPALEKGFQSIYGYTSDGDGIRHALMDKPNVSFADAKFMLVSCSAFVGLLLDKVKEANIEL